MVTRRVTSRVTAPTARRVTGDGVSAGSGSTPLLLDTYTGSAAAYSFRKLRNADTAACIRVRRSSDSAESDINFTSAGLLDTAGLLTFGGAGDVFITTFYDRTGNEKHATQATAGLQYRIVNSGVLFTENSFPSCVSVANSSIYQSAQLTADANVTNGTCYVLGSMGGSLAAFRTGGFSDAGDVAAIAADGTIRLDGDSLTLLSGALADRQLRFITKSGTTFSDFRNGVPGSTGTSSQVVENVAAIGTDGSASGQTFQEGVWWLSSLLSDRAEIAANVNSYWGVY